MHNITRVVVLTLLLIGNTTARSDEHRPKDVRKGKYFLGMLGYYHGFRAGQQYALQFAPFFIQPSLIVIPSVNQQQAVNVQTTSAGENYQEMGSTIQTITSADLVSATDKNTRSGFVNQNHDIDETTRHAPKSDVSISAKAQLKADEEIFHNPINASVTPNYMVAANTNINGTNITTLDGSYANNINKAFLANLSITTASPSNISNMLTTVTEISIITNMTEESSSTESMTNITGEYEWNPEAPYPIAQYPASSYNNEVIDQLSITTEQPNKAEESLPPAADERWKKFSSSNSRMKGFQPLAGLYYDGFLHRPLLMKTGWSPNDVRYSRM